MSLDDFLIDNPYSFSVKQKGKILFNEINYLTEFHYNHCSEYRNIINSLPEKKSRCKLEDIPYLPVRLFKMLDLKSINSNEIIKTLTSSGTTSQTVSKIYIDKYTSAMQTKALVYILSSYIGNKRLPMILADTSAVIKKRNSFSARGAGITGLTFLGRNHFYLFDEEMNINFEGLNDFIEKHKNEKIIIFGFTFMIWKYLYMACKEKGIEFDFRDSVLIHSGGWKKLIELSVDNDTFKRELRKQFGINQIYNFYGMVEQIGSVFMECECGYLHAPDFADIIIRDVNNLDPVNFGTSGLIQVISVLPKSYPGHSLLTEDLGTIIGEDDCMCGRKGKYFQVHGRLKASELRGCSDTHAFN